MTTLEKSLGKPWTKTALKKLFIALVAISFIGLLDATYLTAHHYSGIELNCSITSGCETVTSSKYSAIFGIPVALFGAIYYLSVLFLGLLYLDRKFPVLLKIVPAVTILGLLASIYFVALQLIILKAICQYCMLSAITSTLLFIIGIVIYKQNRKHKT